MTDRPIAAGARAALAGAVLALCIGAEAQTAAPGGAPAPPRPPHQVAPDAPIQPDYYALALSHTSLTDDPAWRALHLRLAGGRADPAFIVLPVQTQAWGFSPMFRALLGARLDQELQRRHLDASRQTDIVDWRGPFVRRADDATVAALAAEHRSATLLALYLGHDADGHAFISLARTAAGRTRVAHRRVDIPQEALPTLDAFTAVLPPLLAELDLGDARPAPAPALAGDAACTKADWELADLPADADPRTTACHALLVGTLMPDFLSRMAAFTQPVSPDRLAWLARAWVEASAAGAKSPHMRSVAHLAFVQLGADGASRETATALVDDGDVVVRPLARMLAAHERVEATPRKSSEAAAREYVASAARGLPAFASAAIEQHAAFTETFHVPDLCDMEAAAPRFGTSAGCRRAPPPARTRPESLVQTRLLESWRLAAAWSALDVEGRVRGSADGIASELAHLPSQLASHPLLREMHFTVLANEASAPGAEAHLAQTRSRLRDYGVAVATLQNSDVLQRHFRVEDLVTLPAETADPAIARMRDDLARLASVAALDYHGALLWRPERNPRWPATFLAAGKFVDTENAVTLAERVRAGIKQPTPTVPAMPGAAPNAGTPPLPPAPPGPSHAIGRGSFNPATVWGMPEKATFEAALAANRMDMGARVGLALIALERGAGLAEARRIVEAQPRRQRDEDALAEAEDWALAGHAFYFAGELPTARVYYARAAATQVGSSQAMLAEERLAAIDGDLRAEFARTQRLARRYDNPWDVAHEAGLLFMRGQPQDAWPLLLPRAQTSKSAALWFAALAGHRIAGTAPAGLAGWIRENGLSGAELEYNPAGSQWLAESTVLDRVADTAGPPSRMSNDGDLSPMWAGGAMMLRAAVDSNGAADLALLDRDMQSAVFLQPGVLPFYAWAAWHATKGQEPMLEFVRNVAPNAGFGGHLAQAMVLSADGRRDDALRALAAARWELGRIGGANPYPDIFFTSPYKFVLASWLMSRKTGERAYAQQGLAVARAYQVIWPYFGWPHAAEALLSTDAKARESAACRAQRLDPASMLLHESGLHPDPKSATCRKATAW